MEEKRSAKPVIAGILLLVSGAFKALGLLVILAASFFVIAPDYVPRFSALLLPVVLLPLLVVAALVIFGAICALTRRRWGWALAGAIAAIPPFFILGIISTILVALSRDEFNKT